MALYWNFDEKVGETTYIDVMSNKVFNYNLYQGNAYLIEVKEWTKKGKDYYEVRSFVLDSNHLRNMLGLNSRADFGDNMFNQFYHKLTKLVLYKDKCRRVREITKLFKMAFGSSLEIEVI